MKPVLVLQHLVNDGPAYLATWLGARRVPVAVRCTEAGDQFPGSLRGFSALAILGGAMSANDDMPSLRQAETLVNEAVRTGVPALGHCLGGQLMARALGASVRTSRAPEVGWQTIDRASNDAARAWLGDAARLTVFQWHFEAFDLPAGAQRVAGNAACPNQAFAVGPHLAMQFHIEIDLPKLQAWSDALDDGYAPALAASPDSVQTVEAMRQGAGVHLAAHHGLADRIYRRWLNGAGVDFIK
ncbi:MAG: type 1 glutamine amidotransferase [Ideonella sp.]|nr:type 1 glutamine amidotransferase [Ideonella sp.]